MMSSYPKSFALIGAAGYIAPRHMDAIKETGNKLVAAMDKSDSVGILDKYFPECFFFTEFERFERHLEKINRLNQGIDYLVVCTPNHLHDSHIRLGLRLGANVICEKPLVLNPWNINAIQAIESETSKKVNPILQLRFHPEILRLKDSLELSKRYEVELTYIAPRGNWYFSSWKGNDEKSGGLFTNIGIHFFDVLHWLFGKTKKSVVYQNSFDRSSGYLILERADVKWFVSSDKEFLLNQKREERALRSLKINDKEYNFTKGFSNLHLESYNAILNNQGFTSEDSRMSIQTTYEIRNKELSALDENCHPYATVTQKNHPFKD